MLAASSGLFALVYGFSNAETDSWSDPITIFALVASAVLLTTFVAIERRAAHPLLPLHIVRDRGRGGAYASIALAGAGVFGVFLFLTFYMQQNLGFSALKTGVAFLPMTAMIVVTSTTVQTKLLFRIGARRLVAFGMTLGVIAMLIFTRLEPGSSYASHVLPGLLVIGAGHGLHIRAGVRNGHAGREGQRGRCGLGDGEHLTAGRRIGGHRTAEHDLRQCREELRHQPSARARPAGRGHGARLHRRVLVGRRDLRRSGS